MNNDEDNAQDENEEWRRRHREAEESMERAQQEEAMRKYRQSHPLIEKVKINPLDAVLELSIEYFETNPEAVEFKLNKVELGKIWNLSINPQNRLIAELVAEYPFIIDSHKGFLIVERKGIEDYQQIIEQRREQQARVKTINEEFPRMMKENEETEENIKRFIEEKYNPLKDRIKEQTNKLKELEEESKKLQQKINDNGFELSKAKNRKESFGKTDKEISNNLSQINSELKELEENQERMLADIQTKRGMIKNRKDMTPEQILKERLDKFSAEIEKLKGEKENLNERLRDDRHEVVKGFLLFLFIIAFPFVVYYVLWHYLQIYEWYWFWSSYGFFLLVYIVVLKKKLGE